VHTHAAGAPSITKERPCEPLIHELRGGFELTHLQRCFVTRRVTNGHEKKLRIGQRARSTTYTSLIASDASLPPIAHLVFPTVHHEPKP